MYIDTSCLAAYYLPEARSESVQKMLQEKERVVISYLTEIELLSAIKKRERMGDLSKIDREMTWKLFKKHRRVGLFEMTELSAGVFKSAEWILEKTSKPLRTLDAIHLGIAHDSALDLYTFDQTLIETAEEFNIHTI